MKKYIAISLLVVTTFSFAATYNVQIVGNTFSPASLSIEAGDTVVFHNNGGFHNVKADDGSFRCADACEATPNDGAGAPSTSWTTTSITFNSVGDFNYYCEIHGGVGGSGMSGVIQVTVPTNIAANISVRSNSFTPAIANVEAGDTVHFTLDQGTHNVRADDDSFECSEGCLNTGKNLSSEPSSASWDIYLIMPTVGSFPYYCELHGDVGGIGMSGTINVAMPDLIFANGFEMVNVGK